MTCVRATCLLSRAGTNRLAYPIASRSLNPDYGAGLNQILPVTPTMRPDLFGIGPTSTVPWAKEAMSYWAKHVPLDNLVMGLPA